MREVAPALTGTHKSGSPPSTRPAKPSSSLLPNVTSDCNGLCEHRANAGVHAKTLAALAFSIGSHAASALATGHECSPTANFAEVFTGH